MLEGAMILMNDHDAFDEFDEDPFSPLQIARVRDANSRVAWWISRNTDALLAELSNLGAQASVRAVADVLRCSKPTVRKFLRMGLLRRSNRRRGPLLRGTVLLDLASVAYLVRLCHDAVDGPPIAEHAFARIRAKVLHNGPNGSFRSLPRFLTVPRAASFLRCSQTTLLRMLQECGIPPKHAPRRRWKIPKDWLPWWSRQES